MTAYLAHWTLIPELSFYDQGESPDSGTYEISLTGGDIHFAVQWVKDGEENRIEFGGPLDGERRKIDVPEGAEVAYTHISDQILQSVVYMGNDTLAFAERRVAADGKLMSVLQRNSMPDGTEMRIVQVYRRED